MMIKIEYRVGAIMDGERTVSVEAAVARDRGSYGLPTVTVGGEAMGPGDIALRYPGGVVVGVEDPEMVRALRVQGYRVAAWLPEDDAALGEADSASVRGPQDE